MELCIKTTPIHTKIGHHRRFNPCFNGTMYKNGNEKGISILDSPGFNPCFNGTMYKNKSHRITISRIQNCFNPCFNGTMYKNTFGVPGAFKGLRVSILVLMELCIKTGGVAEVILFMAGFNPCFNGTMYKNALLCRWSCDFLQFQSLF